MIVLHEILIEFQVYMTMAQPLYGDKKMTSQLKLLLQRMPLMMMLQIRTIYHQWSLDTNDTYDIIQIANDKSMKDIRDKICKDMPVKTEINKPYIDNIDAYNRDRHLITTSLSDRLDLGQNSLPRTQQVRVAVKHTDQIPEFPEHLRCIRLGEEIENISYAIADRNVSFIRQVDDIVDSRDSLDRTPDSIYLTESPVRHTETQK